MVSNNAAEKMATATKKKIKSLESKSQLFSKHQFDVFPKLALDEVTLGGILGKGKFGIVQEIRAINCKVDDGVNGRMKVHAIEDKKFLAEHCIREVGDSSYCIKVSRRFVIRRFTLVSFGSGASIDFPSLYQNNQPGPLTRYHGRPRSFYPGSHRHVRRNHVPRRRVPPSHHHNARDWRQWNVQARLLHYPW